MLMNSSFKESEVQLYLKMLEDVISRMASNSSQCKNWLLAILLAVITYSISHNSLFACKNLCYASLFLFAFLDCYYLCREKFFRRVEEQFIISVIEGDYVDKLFKFNLEQNEGLKKKCERYLCFTFKTFLSFSIIPFYICLFIIVYLI